MEGGYPRASQKKRDPVPGRQVELRHPVRAELDPSRPDSFAGEKIREVREEKNLHAGRAFPGKRRKRLRGPGGPRKQGRGNRGRDRAEKSQAEKSVKKQERRNPYCGWRVQGCTRGMPAGRMTMTFRPVPSGRSVGKNKGRSPRNGCVAWRMESGVPPSTRRWLPSPCPSGRCGRGTGSAH